jgi:hypothetical protein
LHSLHFKEVRQKMTLFPFKKGHGSKKFHLRLAFFESSTPQPPQCSMAAPGSN